MHVIEASARSFQWMTKVLLEEKSQINKTQTEGVKEMESIQQSLQNLFRSFFLSFFFFRRIWA